MFRAFIVILISILILSFGKPSMAADKTIIIMGDSLSAGYRLPPGYSFPQQLENHFQNSGLDLKIINAGVSGDTSAGGRARLDWALAGLDKKPDLVIIEFGGNDALRGIAPQNTRDNLEFMIKALKDKNIPVMLFGMRAPPNMGQEYEAQFNGIFEELAKAYNIPLYPFFLEGVAANPALNLDDGMHPNIKGINELVKRLAPFVKAHL